MIKIISGFLTTVLLITATSCTKTTRKAVENDKVVNADSLAINDGHTSQNALDYDGIYLGILPCADCEGIKTTLYINRDNTYLLRQEYLSKKENKSEEKGKYTWDKTGQIITLSPKTANGSSLKFFIGENKIIMLDQSGKQITGALADHYQLTKDNYALLNKKWNLMTLYDQKFETEKTSKKEGYIIFDDSERRFNTSAGCNTMYGAFKILPNNQLELGQIITSLMACENMTSEGALNKVIGETKSFKINIDELSLLNKDQKVIATFRVPMH